MKQRIDLSPVRNFLESKARNAWLEIGQYDVYLRRAFHIIEHEMVNTLDLANVQNNCDYYGGFWEIYSGVCKLGKEFGFSHLYLESTHNERLRDAYITRGCILIPGVDHNLYKRLE